MSGVRTPVEAPSKPIAQAVVATLDGAPLRAGFPLYVTLFGVDAVVIPVDVYRQLVAARVKLPFVEARAGVHARARVRRRPSTIESDPKVAAFLRERFDLADTIEAAHVACLARFGPERTPSRSRVARFRLRG